MIKKLLASILIIGTLFGFSLFDFFQKKPENQTNTNISLENILAVSWEKNFCDLNRYKKECKTLNPTHYAWNHFVLHGLWPQPRSKQNCSYKFERLPKDLWEELKIYMPGVVSGLAKHEWIKHGSCYGKSEEEYFKDAIKLLKQVNYSAIRDFFIAYEGEVITKQMLNQAIKKSFGNVTRKIQMICQKGKIVELRFSLKGDPAKKSLMELLKDAKPLRGGCQRGRI